MPERKEEINQSWVLSQTSTNQPIELLLIAYWSNVTSVNSVDQQQRPQSVTEQRNRAREDVIVSLVLFYSNTSLKHCVPEQFPSWS